MLLGSNVCAGTSPMAALWQINCLQCLYVSLQTQAKILVDSSLILINAGLSLQDGFKVRADSITQRCGLPCGRPSSGSLKSLGSPWVLACMLVWLSCPLSIKILSLFYEDRHILDERCVPRHILRTYSWEQWHYGEGTQAREVPACRDIHQVTLWNISLLKIFCLTP